MKNLRNFIKQFFSVVFRTLNMSRIIIINLVFFSLLALFFVAITQEKETIQVPNGAALVFNPVGDIVEQTHEIDPMDKFLSEAFDQKEENPEVLLSDITDLLEKAKTDDHIKLMVMNLSGIRQVSLTKLRIISRAIEDFKTSGKKVIAIGDGYTQNHYYLASFADEIWLNPKGWLLIDGYGHYPLYFKSALDKLKISQHIFRVGKFKSAVEPYIRDNMSAEAKEASKLWLNDLWSQYKTDVAKQRNFSIDNFDENSHDLIEKLTQSNGNIAEYALANHWVDQLKTRQSIENDIEAMVGKNKQGDSFKQISFNDYLKANSFSLTAQKNSPNKIAIVVAKGTIVDGTQKPGEIGGDSTAKLLRKARLNDKVKAVVLRVDSPGGSAYASEIIRQEVELIKQANKPLIVSMGTYAASGGYWISAPADTIVAEPTTITGSIGIFGMIMTIEDTLSSIGIHTDGVGTTDIAGFNITRPLTEDMGKLFQLSINRGYHDFISLVAKNRHMTLEQVDSIAQGRVWSGVQAKKLGLVDELGDLNDAIEIAANKANLTDYSTMLVEQELSVRDQFFKNLFAEDSFLASILLPNTQGINSLLSNRSMSSDPVSLILRQLKLEVEQLKQFNDPQNMYTLCIACIAE